MEAMMMMLMTVSVLRPLREYKARWFHDLCPKAAHGTTLFTGKERQQTDFQGTHSHFFVLKNPTNPEDLKALLRRFDFISTMNGH